MKIGQKVIKEVDDHLYYVDPTIKEPLMLVPYPEGFRWPYQRTGSHFVAECLALDPKCPICLAAKGNNRTWAHIYEPCEMVDDN